MSPIPPSPMSPCIDAGPDLAGNGSQLELLPLPQLDDDDGCRPPLAPLVVSHWVHVGVVGVEDQVVGCDNHEGLHAINVQVEHNLGGGVHHTYDWGSQHSLGCVCTHT